MLFKIKATKYGVFNTFHVLRTYSKTTWKILFFGNDTFSVESLSHLQQNWASGRHIEKLEVVTSGKNKQSPVLKFSKMHNIRCHDWPLELSKSYSFDIGIVVSFGHLIPKKIIEIFPLGMINVHASLLPRWRGAAPIIHSIMSGDDTTGVTIMRIRPHQFDIGEIIMQKKCDIGRDEKLPSLHKKLSTLGANCLVETISSLTVSLENAKPQAEIGVTLAPRIEQSWADVRWADFTADQIYNLYRALYNVYNLKTTWYGVAIKFEEIFLPQLYIFESKDTQLHVQNMIKLNKNKSPGSVIFDKQSILLLIVCKDSSCIICSTLKVNGKLMKGVDFYNGYVSKKKTNERLFRYINTGRVESKEEKLTSKKSRINEALV